MKKARAPSKRGTRTESVDEYLAALSPEVRAALGKLRKTIRAAVPEAVEVISYQVPAYKLGGLLVGFAAARDHCTFHLMSTEIMRTHAADLKAYDVGRGSVRFTPDRPLPDALVKKLIRARIAENEKRAAGRG